MKKILLFGFSEKVKKVFFYCSRVDIFLNALWIKGLNSELLPNDINAYEEKLMNFYACLYMHFFLHINISFIYL